MKYLYNTLLGKLGIMPNFFCSDEYFQKAGWNEVHESNKIIVQNRYGEQVLPIINSESGLVLRENESSSSILYFNRTFGNNSFYDNQFVYNPLDYKIFGDVMVNKPWGWLRKELFTLNKNIPIKNIKISSLDDYCYSDIESLLKDWLVQVELGHIEDSENTILRNYFFNGENRRLLVCDGQILGMWIWDENYCFINFRYCITKNVPGLKAYVEFLFLLFNPGRGKRINMGSRIASTGLNFLKENVNLRESHFTWYCLNKF